MKLHRYVDHQRLHIVTKDVISLSISVLLLFRHYISHKITFGAPSSGGVLCSACGAFISVLCLLCLCARLFICALWSPAGKGLTSWLSFVVSNCEFVPLPLVSWVRCGT